MEKQPPTDYKVPEATASATATGAAAQPPANTVNPTHGLNRDGHDAHDTGFKYHIPEAGHEQYQYQRDTTGVGDDRPPMQNTMGERLGSGVRGVFASVHGAGEWLRGGINAAVDRTFGSEEGVSRNEAISRAGQEEIRSGRFSKDSHAGAWDKVNRE
ncbi:uncharacterized protein DSM5745_09247 [Aspergillus mulundensis]|uniref:Uncharacterized protein n=1 Tax=Aspergillus mulundensis TaxID=1810919 RepID=A0A3D8R0E4_9EURO|nr:hypothetical protein DSM5745_09247 [Aspergillus mulundensis]RDW67381.1 hypothetical protein DSM5745_09247 [Aspergillus mulundensis]